VRESLRRYVIPRSYCDKRSEINNLAKEDP
jgi:hypothetical protein